MPADEHVNAHCLIKWLARAFTHSIGINASRSYQNAAITTYLPFSKRSEMSGTMHVPSNRTQRDQEVCPYQPRQDCLHRRKAKNGFHVARRSTAGKIREAQQVGAPPTAPV